MKKHSIPVPAAVFAALAFAPFAQADLETLLPSGETFAFAKAENLAATKASVDKDAYFAALREKILRPAFDAALAGEDGEEKARARSEFSAWEKRFFETFRGEALVALVDVPAEEGDVGAVFIAEVVESFSQEKAQELLRELCGEAPAGTLRRRGDFRRSRRRRRSREEMRRLAFRRFRRKFLPRVGTCGA